jgi:hypothetical protein
VPLLYSSHGRPVPLLSFSAHDLDSLGRIRRRTRAPLPTFTLAATCLALEVVSGLDDPLGLSGRSGTTNGAPRRDAHG